jgi:NADH-quinone oxidoreductase subunit N
VLAVAAMLAAVIAAFLYLRIMVSMWLSEGTASREVSVAFSTRLAICLCVAATLVLGFFPSLLLQLSNSVQI